MRTKAYIVAGEVSGDNHGAGLMSELINTCKDIEFYGMGGCLLYTSPSPRDKRQSRMPSSA